VPFFNGAKLATCACKTGEKPTTIIRVTITGMMRHSGRPQHCTCSLFRMLVVSMCKSSTRGMARAGANMNTSNQLRAGSKTPKWPGLNSSKLEFPLVFGRESEPVHARQLGRASLGRFRRFNFCFGLRISLCLQLAACTKRTNNAECFYLLTVFAPIRCSAGLAQSFQPECNNSASLANFSNLPYLTWTRRRPSVEMLSRQKKNHRKQLKNVGENLNTFWYQHFACSAQCAFGSSI